MTLEDYNTVCAALPQSHLVRQWGGAYVWKIDSKMFAIGFDRADGFFITFKATEIGYEIMREMEGLRPAPYLASRGMKWIQQYAEPGLPDDDLAEHLRASYAMATQRLTKKRQTELGLN